MVKNFIKKDLDWNNILIVIVLVLTASLFAVSYLNYSKSNEEKVPSIEIIEIKCEGCFDLNSVASSLEKNAEVKEIKSLDYNSKEAQETITKYGLTKVPAIVVLSKDIDKINIDEQIFNVGENHAIFDKGVPYIALSSDKIKGVVKIKEIYDSDCKECISFSNFEKQLENSGVKISSYEKINYSAEDNLIRSNNLEFLPTLLISKDIEEYWWLFDNLKNSLTEKEDYFILNMPIPPYKEISTGKIKGLVNVTYILNESCEDCFNVSSLGESFRRMGVYIEKEKYINASSAEGKNIINKYNITKIPTAILSKELSDYPQVISSLENFGTFEKDGSYIFRNLEALDGKNEKEANI